MGSGRLPKQFPADQHAANLAGAGPDLIQFGIAEQPAGCVVIDIAIPSQNLDCFLSHLGCGLGGKQYRSGGILARGLSAVTCLGDGIDISL